MKRNLRSSCSPSISKLTSGTSNIEKPANDKIRFSVYKIPEEINVVDIFSSFDKQKAGSMNHTQKHKRKKNVVIKISGSIERLQELNTVDIYQVKKTNTCKHNENKIKERDLANSK